MSHSLTAQSKTGQECRNIFFDFVWICHSLTSDKSSGKKMLNTVCRRISGRRFWNLDFIQYENKLSFKVELIWGGKYIYWSIVDEHSSEDERDIFWIIFLFHSWLVLVLPPECLCASLLWFTCRRMILLFSWSFDIAVITIVAAGRPIGQVIRWRNVSFCPHPLTGETRPRESQQFTLQPADGSSRERNKFCLWGNSWTLVQLHVSVKQLSKRGRRNPVFRPQKACHRRAVLILGVHSCVCNACMETN